VDKAGKEGPNRILYFHTDVNGAPEEMTDSDGKIVWETGYQVWGNTIQEKDHGGVEQNLRYQGQYLDRETGLHYNLHRYYDPDVGRFMVTDPIGLLGGINLYQYAPNPLSWIDPLGQMCATLKKSSHALQRHREGRPIGAVINDLQNARSSDILKQSDGRWVVLGPNGRAHIIEKDGSEIVTSMRDISRKNIQHRMNRNTDRWERPTQSELDEFRDIFSDYVRF
ncbi:RHS repeat domain-containing protein, partial [Escherichia coli]